MVFIQSLMSCFFIVPNFLEIIYCLKPIQFLKVPINPKQDIQTKFKATGRQTTTYNQPKGANSTQLAPFFNYAIRQANFGFLHFIFSLKKETLKT
jgi:hypothetical protein